LDDFILLSEDDIYRISIAMVFYCTQQLAKGAGLATLMAALKLKERLKGRHVVLQMSGGNASAEEIEREIVYPEFKHGIA
jgi:threonine dehydratase